MPDLGLLRGAITLVTLATFIGICWWAYRPANRERFEEDGMLAFGDEKPRTGQNSNRQDTENSSKESTEESES